MSREWSRILDSPAIRASNEAARYLAQQQTMLEVAVPPAFMELQQILSRHVSLVQSPLLEGIQRILDAETALKHVEMPKLPKHIIESSQRIGELQRWASPAIAGIAQHYIHAMASPAYLAWFHSTAIGNILGSFDQEEAPGSAADAEKLLTSVLDWVQEQIASLPRGWVSFKGMIWLLFTVVLPLYTLIDSRIVEQADTKWKERHSREMQHRLNQIAEEIETLRPRGRERQLYVVTRRLSLRAGPSTDFEVVDSLLPNMLVEEIARDGHWVHLQYFDFVQGVLKSAWVYKRSLMPVSQPYFDAPDSFIGMWEEREDMRDSAAWVRHTREAEWGT